MNLNILLTFGEWSEIFKNEYIKNNKICSKRFVYSSFTKLYPEFIQKLENLNCKQYFREILYCILKDIEYIPLCPICKNPLPLRSFVKGFNIYCSKTCAAQGFSDSNEIKEKISKSRIKKYKELRAMNENSVFNKFETDIDINDRNYYIIKNYCKHGDIHIYKKILFNIESIGNSTCCIQCNKDIYESYIPSEEEIQKFQNEFPSFYDKHHFALKYSWWILYYPKYLKILKTYYEKYIDVFDENDPSVLAESYYVFKYNLKERPKCDADNCNEHVRFARSCNRYNCFCDKHMVGYNCSHKEHELEDFIKSLNVNYEHNNRTIIDKELDFYFPEHRIALEFNGCWFHSDRFKSKNYHKDKYEACLNKNIQLLTIWEDDWIYKQDIIKNLIKNKLGLSEYKIGARNTYVKEVSIQESRKFLDDNHLQGYCNAKYRYGLYYEGELVEIMTFGNSRFKKGEIELLRLCSKQNWSIAGGSEKLFKFFLTNNKWIKEIISYANCDISVGKVYKLLNFKYIHTTENWSWFYNGKRVNRFNKIRFNQEELNLAKCYSSGTMKFVYNNFNY